MRAACWCMMVGARVVRVSLRATTDGRCRRAVVTSTEGRRHVDTRSPPPSGHLGTMGGCSGCRTGGATSGNGSPLFILSVTACSVAPRLARFVLPAPPPPAPAPPPRPLSVTAHSPPLLRCLLPTYCLLRRLAAVGRYCHPPPLSARCCRLSPPPRPPPRSAAPAAPPRPPAPDLGFRV